jgi:hypothetical protein
MGFSSQDDLLNQITVNGKYARIDYQKTTAVAGVAGTWTDLGTATGSVPANTYAGTSLTFVATDDTWSEGAVYHGGDVSTATKHFLNGAATVFAAAGAPWILMCVDQVGYVPITGADVTGTGSRTITMTPISNTGAKVDRYPNGVGLRAYFSTEVAPTAGGPNLTVFTYTSTGGTTGRVAPATVGFAATPVTGMIPHSGNAATRYGPFLPLAVGYNDGIKDLENFTLTGGTAYTGSGQLVLHLVKPLWQIPIPSNGILTERDFVNQLPSLPRIRDGACLRFLLFQTGATTTTSPVMVSADVGWGG